MTNVKTGHPSHLPYIELTDKGRKISFRRDCLEEIEIQRKVNEQDWKLLVKNIRTPYTDEESFPDGTKLSYSIKLTENGEEKEYILDARL